MKVEVSSIPSHWGTRLYSDYEMRLCLASPESNGKTVMWVIIHYVLELQPIFESVHFHRSSWSRDHNIATDTRAPPQGSNTKATQINLQLPHRQVQWIELRPASGFSGHARTPYVTYIGDKNKAWSIESVTLKYPSTKSAHEKPAVLRSQQHISPLAHHYIDIRNHSELSTTLK